MTWMKNLTLTTQHAHDALQIIRPIHQDAEYSKLATILDSFIRRLTSVGVSLERHTNSLKEVNTKIISKLTHDMRKAVYNILKDCNKRFPLEEDHWRTKAPDSIASEIPDPLRRRETSPSTRSAIQRQMQLKSTDPGRKRTRSVSRGRSTIRTADSRLSYMTHEPPPVEHRWHYESSKDMGQEIKDWISLLDTFMHKIIRDYMRTPQRSAYDPLKVVTLENVDHMGPEGAALVTEDIDLAIDEWTKKTATEDDFLTAKGMHRYGCHEVQHPGVRYELNICKGRVSGTAKHKATWKIRGWYDAEVGTIQFTESKSCHCFTPREYNGHFTPWGIVGTCHKLSRRPGNTEDRGRFVMWLEKDNYLKDINKKFGVRDEDGEEFRAALSTWDYSYSPPIGIPL